MIGLLFAPDVEIADDGTFDFATGGGGFVSNLISTIVIIGYSLFSYLALGNTLGKKALGIKPVGANGVSMTQEETIKRVAIHGAVYIVTLIPALGFLISALFAIYYLIAQPIMAGVGDFQTLRDKLSGTRVVRA